jgi:hypothetical protein
MSIVLVGSTSGSCTLQEQAVAGTTVLTLPAVTGTVLTDTSPKAGNVIQVVSQNYGTQFGTASSTFTDTGITVSITPTSASSKILVLVTLSGMYKDATNTGVMARLLRGATVIQKFTGNAGFTNTTTSNNIGGVSFNYLDSPATTSSTTYKIQGASGNNTGTAYINVDGGSNDSSSITLLEIAA